MKNKKMNVHMKNNRPHILIFLLILIATFNITKAQTKIGIKAGVNFSNVSMKDETGNMVATQSSPGAYFGLTVDIPIMGDFYIQPAALYFNKGFKQETGGFFGSANNFKVSASYIEVPVNILYKPRLGAGNLLLGAGPYIAYGTGGKWKSDNEVLIGDIRIDNNGKTIFKNDFMDGEFGSYLYGKPLDYGANFLIGYEFLNKLSIQLDAHAGLANLQPELSGVRHKGKLNNTGFGISIGYKF